VIVMTTVGQLADALVELSNEVDIRLQIHRSSADGFGAKDVPILELGGLDGERVRVWEQGGGDFLFEVGANDEPCAWWARRPKKQADLPRVVLELARGRYYVVRGRVTVRLGGRVVALPDRL